MGSMDKATLAVLHMDAGTLRNLMLLTLCMTVHISIVSTHPGSRTKRAVSERQWCSLSYGLLRQSLTEIDLMRSLEYLVKKAGELENYCDITLQTVSDVLNDGMTNPRPDLVKALDIPILTPTSSDVDLDLPTRLLRLSEPLVTLTAFIGFLGEDRMFPEHLKSHVIESYRLTKELICGIEDLYLARTRSALPFTETPLPVHKRQYFKNTSQSLVIANIVYNIHGRNLQVIRSDLLQVMIND